MEDNIRLTVTCEAVELNLEMDTYMIILSHHAARLHLTHKEWSFTAADSSSLRDLGPGCMV